MALTAETQAKAPSEVRLYDFDWSKFKEFETPGVTINAVTSKTVTPTGPTLGANIINGAHVQFTISGGTADTAYLLEVLVTTTSGATLKGGGYLYVTDFDLPSV